MKPKIVKILDEENLVRDTRTNAVLNNDTSSLEKYKAKRNREIQLRDDVDHLKQQMTEIEKLLRQLVERE